MKKYYYNEMTDDIVNSAQQDFELTDDYQILPIKKSAKIWNKIIRYLAAGFGWLYSRLFLHVHVIGRKKLKSIDSQGGYFVYGNHTQAMGDVFTPLTIYPIQKFYAIAGQANWGIPIIGKYLVRYGGLPVGKDLQQSIKLVKAVKTVIDENGLILIYPEAHVWPYYTKIRPFDETSFNFPVSLNAPSFTQTTTYTKNRFFKRPKITVYIDGPFFPDQSLPRKKRQKKLYNEIQKQLIFRAKLSNYSYIDYEQRKR